ncbi:hypothetical protein GCM10009105_14140 [Dokdonella soli]|uniref:Uncharacterized protein n=1 Tax=Dokdonella soli TaxID=529810 RepID=A0ABP3TPF7_9GAMM
MEVGTRAGGGTAAAVACGGAALATVAAGVAAAIGTEAAGFAGMLDGGVGITASG